MQDIKQLLKKSRIIVAAWSFVRDNRQLFRELKYFGERFRNYSFIFNGKMRGGGRLVCRCDLSHD